MCESEGVTSEGVASEGVTCEDVMSEGVTSEGGSEGVVVGEFTIISNGIAFINGCSIFCLKSWNLHSKRYSVSLSLSLSPSLSPCPEEI